MSGHKTSRELHDQHADVRNEVRRMERHEADLRRVLHDRWWRRMQPLVNTASVPSDDFSGCVE